MNRNGNSRGLFNKAIDRRQALRMIGGAAGLAGAATLGWPLKTRAQESVSPPNIVFILTDDHRWDMMGCMGHPFLQTPNMDRLAAEGVLFENAFVTTSLCSPSRASFLTGQYASVHGIRNNYSRWDEARNITYMQHLNEKGYDCAFIGKWHMPGGNLPNLPGVELFVSFTRKDGQGDYYDCPLFVNHQPTPSRKPYITEELTDYAIDFINKDRDKPFCIYLSHKAVHHDWRPPADLKGKYDHADLSFLAPESDKYNTWTGINWLEGTMGNMHSVYRRYCECLEAVDRNIGRVLSTLEAKGLMDNTIVIYAGDNGYMWGEHRLYAKHYPYEESIRIPFIVRAPSLVPDPGRRDERMVLNLDLPPTLLDLAGIPIPSVMQGQNMTPLLRSGTAPGRDAFIYELFRDFPFGGRVPPNKTLRTQRYKLIEWELCHPPELYDLAEDPREMNNLLKNNQALPLAAEMKDRLDQMMNEYHIIPGIS